MYFLLFPSLPPGDGPLQLQQNYSQEEDLRHWILQRRITSTRQKIQFSSSPQQAGSYLIWLSVHKVSFPLICLLTHECKVISCHALLVSFNLRQTTVQHSLLPLPQGKVNTQPPFVRRPPKVQWNQIKYYESTMVLKYVDRFMIFKNYNWI